MLQSRISAAQRTEETVFEWQTYTAANPRDRNGDTEMRHLRSGGPHYWEENKSTDTPIAFI